MGLVKFFFLCLLSYILQKILALELHVHSYIYVLFVFVGNIHLQYEKKYPYSFVVDFYPFHFEKIQCTQHQVQVPLDPKQRFHHKNHQKNTF